MKPLSRWALALVSVMALACGEDDKSEDTVEDDDASPDSSMPVEGSWSAGNQRVLSDSCGIFEDDGDDTGDAGDDLATITHTGDDTFTISADELLLDCTMSGSGFTCVSEPLRDDLTDDGLDAVLISTYTASSPGGATAATLQLAFDMECEGTACSALEESFGSAFPCSVVIEVDVTHVG